MDLAQTVPLLHQALKVVSDTVASGGRVLFVGTKRQASQIIADSAKRSAQYYVNARWLGGMLTNWNTISNSIKRLRKVDGILAEGEASQLTKKERLTLTRERDKLERALGGIKDMGGTPDLLFVIDTNKEAIAIQEAKRLKIPVVAILDSNCNPDEITHPIPGNDDASRSINLYCDLIAKAALDGIARQQGEMGIDLGEAENPVETALEEAPAKVEDKIASEIAVEPVEVTADAAEPSAAQAIPAVQAIPTVEEKTEEEKPETSAKIEPEEKSPAQKEPDSVPPAKETKAEVAEKKPNAPVVDKAPAKAAESENADEGPLFKAPKGEPDDLKKISGVGPVLEAKLHELGITKYAQVAAFKTTDVEKVDARLNFKGRIERDGWIAQAKELAAE